MKRLLPLLFLLAACTSTPVATESYLINLNLPNANSSQVSQIALGKAQQAFKRLVTS